MFCTRVACLLLCKEEGSSPVSAITERRGMCLYQVPLSMSLLRFGMGTMLANIHVWHYVSVKSRFQHAREEYESKSAICFRCLMFSLSGPCELFFYCILLPLGPELW